MTERGQTLIEAVVTVAILGILVAVVLPQASHFWRVAQVERETAALVADLRGMQEQSRSNDYRASGLKNFSNVPQTLTMYFSEKGWTIRRSQYEIYYRHIMPDALRLETLRSAANVTINFGQNGGSVQNNTFRIYAATEPALCRYVIISGMGRIRSAISPPSGEY